jgi:DNA-binding HxlR family transcriptional regulator
MDFEKMDWRDFSTENCPVAGAMKILGDKWTLLILRDAFNGIHRFADFQSHLGIPRALLTRRLRTLEDAGILERREYREPGARPRREYRLTAKGFDLQHILVALREWGDAHVNPPGAYPWELVEKDTGERVRLALVRECDGQVVADRAITARPGPGIRMTRDGKSKRA